MDKIITNGDAPDGQKPIVDRFVYGAFFWCMGGVAGIYGIRLWHDLPIHPSFLPLIGAVFSGVLAFTLVMTFSINTGPMDFEFGQIKVKGGTGPLVMWCICFLAIAYGLYLLGLGDAVKQAPPNGYKSCSVAQAMTKTCELKSRDADGPATTLRSSGQLDTDIQATTAPRKP